MINIYPIGTELPLAQSLIIREMTETPNFPLQQVKGLVTLIADYVESAATVDTVKALHWFQSKIPPDKISKLKELSGKIPKSLNQGLIESLACVSDEPQERNITCNTTYIEDSQERKLIAYATIYFLEQVHECACKGYDSVAMATMLNLAQLDFLGCISGVTVINRSTTPEEGKERSHSVVFGHSPWYKDLTSRDIGAKLSGNINTVTSFLTSKRYKVVKQPQAGHIAMYHTPVEVRHFGIVESVHLSGIYIISKFGHTYRHRWDLVMMTFGRYITYLLPPEQLS